MVWIGRVLERTFMTAHTLGGYAGESATHVTLGTGHCCVGSRQREPCKTVVKFGSRPGRCCMAAFAGSRKVCALVIRVRRFLVQR